LVLGKTEYNENYFNGRNTGVRLAWGYADIRELAVATAKADGPALPYPPHIKRHIDKIPGGVNLTGVTVLDIGGAVGNYAKYGKQLGIGTWDILDLNIDDWCNLNKYVEVDNFFTGDAVVELQSVQNFKNNSYDIIFSSSFLECIDPSELPTLIPEMNRVAKTIQIHIVSTTPPTTFADKYNFQTLAWWATQGFTSGTILIDYNSQDLLTVP
jgi:ubiquinone/menaquinone biosynthesis C-methylase UbiE